MGRMMPPPTCKPPLTGCDRPMLQADVTLWQEADTVTRRRALAHRWMLRASTHPDAVPVPACPVARMLHAYESAYRRLSACRGVVRDD